MFMIYSEEERMETFSTTGGGPASAPYRERESVVVLRECIELQNKKGRDYQNPNSDVRQAQYYESGIRTIREMIQQKMLRAKSLEQAVAAGGEPNFESLEDTYKDIINYSSFAVAWLRGEIDGQEIGNDIFGKKPKTTS
jgi:hypothetical protein